VGAGAGAVAGRGSCFKDADKRWKLVETECRKLSNTPVDDPKKKK
jgi:hypothetical protein